MFPVIEQWRKSGMSKEGFAKKHGIGHGAFHYWCSLYHGRGVASSGVAKQKASEAKPAFVPMDCAEVEAIGATSVVIVLPSGTRIEVS